MVDGNSCWLGRKIWGCVLGVLVMCFCGIVCGGSAWANFDYATGGSSSDGFSGGGACPAYKGCHDCGTAKRCPRWILITGAEYKELVKNRTYIVDPDKYSLSGLQSICQHDAHVLIAGSQDANGHLLLFNKQLTWTNMYKPLKQKHVYSGYTEDGVVYNNTNWDDSMSARNKYGIFGWKTDSKSMTYSELIEAVINASGKDEHELAVICESMLENELKAYAIDASGNILNKDPIDTSRVSKGGTATVYKKDIGGGYTFEGCWRNNKTDSTCSAGTGNSYSKKFDGEGAVSEVYAVYTMNAFEGRARVDSGDSIGENPTSTGYVNTNKTVEKELDCGNETCDVFFDLYLKTKTGAGKVKYETGWSHNGSEIGWIPSPLWVEYNDPSTDGSFVSSGEQKLGPGQSVCFYLRFKPSGTSGNSVDVGACAKVKVSTFEGKIDIDGAASGSTGWQSSGTTITKDVPCTAAGCSVTFSHNLKRANGGIGTTDYTITRESNYAGVSSGQIGSGTFPTSGETITDSVTLKPGMVVCETLNFKPDNKSETSSVSVKACVSASGNAQSADGATLLDIKVTKNDGDYYSELYAKPGDTIKYKTVYQPTLQYAYSIIGNQYSDWANGFAITGAVNGKYKYDNGSDVTETVYLARNLTDAEVGNVLVGMALTNPDGDDYSDIRITPKQITFKTNADGTNTGERDPNSVVSAAKVMVPYNFNTAVTVDDLVKDTLDAGGDGHVNYDVGVEDRENLTVGGIYVTPIDSPKSKVIVYAAIDGAKELAADSVGKGEDYSFCDGHFGGASYCKEQSVTIGGDNKRISKNDNDKKYQANFTVPDLVAGTRLCVAAAVYPANSGEDTNLNASGSDTWRVSASKCYTVAKKPTFQVWGGNLYSVGNVKTSAMTKIVEDQRITFSSWAERDVTTMGVVTELASGAATGLADNSAKGGARNSAFCKDRVPLNLANYSMVLTICPTLSSRTGLSGVVADVPDLKGLIDGLPVEDDIKIEYDINHDETVNSIDEISKTIIYTTGDIDINCNVNRIDAILVAGGTINTCADAEEENYNDAKRSNQLVVNGAIIANRLILGRTFGAGVGEYSKIPAEIINYDASIVLWARNKINASDYGRMSQVYQHELAPRR